MSKLLEISGVTFTKAQWAAICDHIGNEVDMQENNDYSEEELEEIHDLDNRLSRVFTNTWMTK